MRHAHAAAAIDAGLRLDHAFLVFAVVIGIELVAGATDALNNAS